MTFLELCQQTRQECGIQGDGPAAVTSQVGILRRVVEWVRDADLFIQRLHPDWGFLWSEFTDDTIEGSADLTEPPTVAIWDIESFAKDRGTSTGMPLEVMTFREYRNNHYTKEKQEPFRICILPDNSLKLEYPADGVYEIYGNYWRTPVTMTANLDEPLYAAEFHRAVVARAKMWFFEDSEMLNLYQAAEKELVEKLVQMRTRYLNNQTSLNSPQQMVIRPE